MMKKTTKTITCTYLAVFTLAALLLQMIGLFLFVFGFFPVKPALSGVSGVDSYLEPGSESVVTGNSTFPHDLKSLYQIYYNAYDIQELSGIPPLFDRLIMMVIDGLPAEFVLGKDGYAASRDLMEALPYTQSLLSMGTAIGYHAKAAPPTVTMPRLKAMVSGAIGGFLDVAFNFNTQAMLDDNLLDQFFRIGWKMVMLGDETWLKLFPGLFVRHDGVSSFFVKDTVQVDHNVSRHLRNELGRDDWNLLILHYLGLDHVGHIGGRSSFLMVPKLKEMDEVVKMIHSTINTNDNNQGRTLLVVASDHGMTESGNHGGSSFEETDSLALFIGLKNDASDYESSKHNCVFQVDMAPTLALLLGMPIPKNNVGVLISEIFDSLPDHQRLRALELNSWQLLRLVEAQLPGLSCRNYPFDDFSVALGSGVGDCSSSSIEREICCLYINASNLHRSWKSKKESGSLNGDDLSSTVAAYNKFLKTASNWLSQRVTDKPVSLLAFGIVAMALSCLTFLGTIIIMNEEIYGGENSSSKSEHKKWLEEIFVSGVVLILVTSMGSSSMVEEEQYIWNFFISTAFLLLLRRTLQSLPDRSGAALCFYKTSNFQLLSILLLLIFGRILRGWHQGGVNWSHLPDIAKWLEQSGSDNIRLVQLVSVFLVTSVGFTALYLLRHMKRITQGVGFCLLIPGLLVLLHMIEFKINIILAQMIYVIIVFLAIGAAVALPWIIPILVSGTCSTHDFNSSSAIASDIQYKYPLREFRDSSYLIGLTYMLCWCLLQLLLQQPINSMPVFLLLMQILTSMLYFSYGSPRNKEWLEVALLYYIGMAGHFALGNSNSLATIDVAGAFIGLSSYSTLLSGILMFLITYASPMLILLSMVTYISVKDTSCIGNPQNSDSGHFLKTMIGFPCLVPLCLNSILLTAYTVVLLLMSNHLFVWSVFSPKYLYVCATTVCVYVGVFVVAVTETYVYFVVAHRRRKMNTTISN